jgi:hypothetical protein
MPVKTIPSVYIVTYEYWDTFEILEVFKTEELAEKWRTESLEVKSLIEKGYKENSFYVIEKILWD